MLEVRIIESLEEPALAPYKTMKWQHEHRQQGIFVAEGEKVVRRLIESDLTIISLLLPPKWIEPYRQLLESRPENVTAYVAKKELLEAMTGYSMYQGVLGLAKIPPQCAIDELLQKPGPLLLVALENLANAENLGGVIRNCAAFGAHGIIVGETCCSPYLRRSVRSSMGTIFKSPLAEPPSLKAALEQLKRAGVHCVAAHPHADKRTLSQARMRGDCCIVLGSEGQGISPEILGICDEVVSIPMRNDVDSLNVNTAGAVFLYEANRQRNQA